MLHLISVLLGTGCLFDCEKYNMDNFLFSTQGPLSQYNIFGANLTLPDYCELYYPMINTVKINVMYFKVATKFVAVYDSNSYDEDICYERIDSKGLYNLTRIWEVEIGDDFELGLSDTYFKYGEVGIQKTYYCSNGENPNSTSVSTLYTTFIPLMTNRYRYYITSWGKIFKKIEIEKLYKDNIIFAASSWFSPYNFLPNYGAGYNNATVLYSKTAIYHVYYVAKFLPNVRYKAEGTQNGLCLVDDIVIKKIYSFT